MRVDSSISRLAVVGTFRADPDIQLSRWTNEPLPDLRNILSLRDVARLTRRPRWLLGGLVLIGRFPAKKRYRGRPIGWCRSELLDWMSRDPAVERERPCPSRRPPCLTRRVQVHPVQAP